MNSTRRQDRRLEVLCSERDFLLASIADLETEHDAGDLGDEDFAALQGDYLERCAATLREIEQLEAGDASTETPHGTVQRSRWSALRALLGRRGIRRSLIAIGLVCMAGLASLLAAHLAGVRLPGESATGSVNLPPAQLIRQELAQASVLGSEHLVSQAVSLYDDVLHRVPDQPEALAYRGWLVRLAGLQAHSKSAVREGDASLARAVHVAPHYADARAFYGLALLEDERQPKAAIVQFRAFANDAPSTALLRAVAPAMKTTFTAEHAVVPLLIARAASS